MRCRVSIEHEGPRWIARCEEYPACVGQGATRDEALARLRASVTFWLESCPCDQTAADGLVLDVIRDAR